MLVTVGNGARPEEDLVRAIKTAHPNHHVKLYSSWRVDKGARIASSANWIVDQDGANYATIATTRDLVMPADYCFERHNFTSDLWILFDKKLDSDFPWVKDENTHIVLMPKIAADSCSCIPAAVAHVLDMMLDIGSCNDVLTVMLLQEELKAHASHADTPSDLSLRWLQLAESIIFNFWGSYQYDEERYWPEVKAALNALYPLIDKVSMRILNSVTRSLLKQVKMMASLESSVTGDRD